ncbi:MAG: nitroreductase family protein [candidate division WOR-3 bacterium]|nr:nitroreductase family protein [candidate division WOR-3 bacterium]
MSSEKNKVMNPVIEAINNRMSIRSYEPKPIPRDIINTIIEAGNQAPSRGRQEKGSKEFLFQPWRFVVVENSEFKQKLIQTTYPFWKNMTESMKETHPEIYEQVMMQYEAMPEPKDMVYYSAPVILFVIGPAGYAVSCALACENIMIAATSLGLGSCYVGFGAMVKGNAEVVQALELTDDERIYGPIVLGYPKDEPSTLASIRPKKKEPKIKWI